MTPAALRLPAAIVAQPVLPWWLLAVVGVALVGFTVWRVVAERGDRRLLRSWARRLVIVALLLVVAVRPGVPGGSAQASVAALNVFFVVDTTSSIAAEDWDGDRPRLEGVRSDVDEIAAELAGARFSLISFDSTAVLRTPLTDDSAAVVTAASVMNQEITYYSSGSSVTEASDLLAERLREARDADPERANVVYYLGDGEQTADEPPGSFTAATGDVDGGAVLGYGTAEGGRMKVFDGYGDAYSSTEYIKDRSQPGEPDALSVIDEDALRTMASQLGVEYVHRDAGDGVEAVVADARDGAVASDEGRAEAVVDLYWIAAVPLFLLALVEVAVVARALAEIRVRPRREDDGDADEPAVRPAARAAVDRVPAGRPSERTPS